MGEHSRAEPGLAVLVTEDCMRKVAGMTVGERLVAAFRAAGVDSVAIVGPGRCRFPEDARRVASLEELGDERTWIVARTDVVVDPVFARFALEAARSLGRPVRWGRSAWVRLPGSPWGPPDEEIQAAGVFVSLEERSGWAAKRALIKACRKPVHIDGVMCRAVGRPVSGWISTLLVELPVRPNMVTAASMAVGLVGAAVACIGTWAWLGVAATLLFVSWILDNCDGEIARTKYSGSTWGAWFDIYADFVVNEAFVLGLGVGLWRLAGNPAWLALSCYTALLLGLYNAVVFRTIHRLGVPDEFAFHWWFEGSEGREERGQKGAFHRFFDALRYLGRRDTFVVAYFVAAWFRVLQWVLVATAVGATFTGVLTILHLVDERRKRGR